MWTASRCSCLAKMEAASLAFNKLNRVKLVRSSSEPPARELYKQQLAEHELYKKAAKELEIMRLRRQVADLDMLIKEAASAAPPSAASLSSGSGFKSDWPLLPERCAVQKQNKIPPPPKSAPPNRAFRALPKAAAAQELFEC